MTENNSNNLEEIVDSTVSIKTNSNYPCSCDDCPLITRVYNKQTEQYEVSGCPFKSPTEFYTESWIGPWNRDCATEIRTYQ